MASRPRAWSFICDFDAQNHAEQSAWLERRPEERNRGASAKRRTKCKPQKSSTLIQRLPGPHGSRHARPKEKYRIAVLGRTRKALSADCPRAARGGDSVSRGGAWRNSKTGRRLSTLLRWRARFSILRIAWPGLAFCARRGAASRSPICTRSPAHDDCGDQVARAPCRNCWPSARNC